MTIFEHEPVPVDDPVRLRAAKNLFPAGVTAVCGMVGDKPEGLIITHFASVSLKPPLVLVCMATTSTTWPKLRAAPRIGISVLGEDTDPTPLYIKGIDRFETVDWEATDGGAVFIRGSALWLDCSIVQETPMGTHDLVVLQVESATEDPSVLPLVWHGGGFRKLVPGPFFLELAAQEDFVSLMERSRGRDAPGVVG